MPGGFASGTGNGQMQRTGMSDARGHDTQPGHLVLHQFALESVCDIQSDYEFSWWIGRIKLVFKIIVICFWGVSVKEKKL